MQRKTSTKRYRDRQRRARRKAVALAAVLTVTVICGSRWEADADKAEATVTESPEFNVEATPTPEEKAIAENTITIIPVPQYPCPLDLELQIWIRDLCEDHHIDPAIIMAMCDMESDYRADHMGDGGDAYGIMQIQPQWHEERIERLGVFDLLDPYQNVAVGIDYLAELLDYGNGIEWALMAYNGGPSYAYEMEASGIVSDYAQEVMAQAEALTEGVQLVVYG